MFKLQKNSVGYDGEEIAGKFLEREGYEILQRNWCNTTGRRIGEIDIIARDRESGMFIFVEVKTRNINGDEGKVLPEEQITRAKLNKLNKIVEVYIKENKLWKEQWRVDAITVLIIVEQKKAKINHIKSIFL